VGTALTAKFKIEYKKIKRSESSYVMPDARKEDIEVKPIDKIEITRIKKLTQEVYVCKHQKKIVINKGIVSK